MEIDWGNEVTRMMEQIPQLAYELTQADASVWGVSVLDSSGQIVYQTENWNITAEAQTIMRLAEGTQAITISDVRYVVVENIPERIIATNVTGKGHLIVCPAGRGKIVCYINPAAGPRDALLNVMTYARKIGAFL